MDKIHKVKYQNILWITSILLVFMIEFITQTANFNPYLFADDAYYYFTIVRNILRLGYPTLDALTSTNGFHPLWVILLLPIFSITGNTAVQFELIRLFQIFLAVSTLFLVHRSSLSLPALPKATLILLLLIVLRTVGLNGMETTLTMFMFMVFYYSAGYTERSTGSICLRPAHYFLLSLLFLSRIDTLFFIAPVVCIDLYNQFRQDAAGPRRLSALLFKLMLLSFLPGLYILVSISYMDLWVPISAAVKSAGVPGINARFLSQVFAIHEVFRPRLNFPNFALLIASVTVALIVIGKRHEKDQWLAATVVGAWGFIGSQVFISKWTAWEWYLYPSFPLIYCSFISIWPRMRSFRFIAVPLAVICALSVYNLVIYTVKSHKDAAESAKDFRLINMSLAEELNARIPNQLIAMGDRAGSFAFFYGGAVFQTEGLVGNGKYLNALQKQSAEAYLRRLPIDYLLEYEKDLGSYESAEIEVPRSRLSGGPISKIRVCRSKEVMKRPTAMKGFADDIVYLWEWPPC